MSTHNMFFVEKKEKYYAFTLSYLKLCRIPRKPFGSAQKLVLIAEWSYFLVVLIAEFHCICLRPTALSQLCP